jgi:hypothetical protein
MKIVYLPILMIVCLARAYAADPIDDVASLIRQRNMHALARYFAPSVEIAILGEENIYTNVQSELILDKFFAQNKPLSVKILHKVSSNANYQFAVLTLTTDKGTYRVAYTMKGADGKLMLIELRIEAEKVK